MHKLLFLIIGGMLLAGCSGTFIRTEVKVVNDGDGIMRLWKTDCHEDSLFLRQKATLLTLKDLHTDVYRRLKQRMLLTVNDTTDPGVGIAAPQVGVSKRLIAVQRFDKPGEPVECYVNPQIEYLSEKQVLGVEGCLSVPNRSDSVWRSEEIIITYLCERGKEKNVKIGAKRFAVNMDINYSEEWKMVRDTVDGFTAVIFQHEIDHLDGILFTDRVAKELKNQNIN